MHVRLKLASISTRDEQRLIWPVCRRLRRQLNCCACRTYRLVESCQLAGSDRPVIQMAEAVNPKAYPLADATVSA